ncbi:5-dehydro-2-deoxygluconokinase [Phyllobacterium leguminum]|uniref:5-dehydro-2-deoxygluconokinase n=1 Tax=Phyllobacterium leguminum TaxID=314237 RepID=A0A318T7U3_9HYPH|nr:5-dehydro-2-deoxygluconokinase [Phyllobacterium leguminum]
MKTLDVITIGRASVDLYGTQIGGRLEDMGSFEKYIGGSPTNIACGAARLGLKTALISRVGDEHMGRFILEQLAREGVSTAGVKVDPERLTALVILGIRDDTQFPLIFYRENCADMALCEDDIDEAFIAVARAIVVTGTHLSHPHTEAAVIKALRLARKHGLRTALDIDYRPNLWGVAGHGEGESRFVESAKVTARLQSTLHYFDLIVGTEEEFHIAGGSTDTIAALRAVRAVSAATLVCKRGPLGAVAFEGEIPDSLDNGQSGQGFPIEVFNVLGAGDGFFAGLLRGWMSGADWSTSLKFANACGAFAVSRHGCTPAYPSWEELQFFLARGVKRADLRNDRELEQIHWSTTRHTRAGGDWSTMRVFAFDHRKQLEDMPGYTPQKGAAFKELCLDAALRVQAAHCPSPLPSPRLRGEGRIHAGALSIEPGTAEQKEASTLTPPSPCNSRGEGKGVGQSTTSDGYGILCDNRIGRSALHRASGTGLWIGRPAEWPGSRPLMLEPELGSDCGGLAEWAREQVVKVLCFCHPDDDADTRAAQEAIVKRLFEAARRNRLEFLLEIIPSKVGATGDMTVATLVHQFYAAGIYPDWWKLESMKTETGWANAIAAIEAHDPHTRGIVVLGLDAPEAELAESFDVAARFDLVKGFAVGRTIFADAARRWLGGEISDGQAVDDMAARYARLCRVWDAAREKAKAQ